MNKRPSIYIGNSLEKIITEVQGSHGNKVSTVINTVADRYAVIIKRNTPTLAKNEWLALMDVLNGYVTSSIELAANGIAWSLEDALTMEGLAEKWEINKDFTDKIAEMSFEQKLSIIHVSERFWGGEHNEAVDYKEMLNSTGAKLIE